uniref:WD repeat domain 33 n=1 Tax=Seriola lalandi dorsalis TaxID=1841481 RepID=A0A3B4X1P7_SERLL
MATDIGSPQRFFHMPRFQHQAPRQVFYKRPDFAQQQAMQQLTFDGKRMRKAVNRKTIDYNPSVIRYLENRLWQRDHRDFRAIQPDAGCYNDLVPPVGMLNNPMNAVTTKVKTNWFVLCVCLQWTPEGRRLVTGASSGEFTLWNGLTFNFETILQAHDSPVRAMTWSHNDMWMLTADHGGYVKYWQSNMNNVKMFQAHKEAIREARFIPNLPFSVVTLSLSCSLCALQYHPAATGGRHLTSRHMLLLLWLINDRCKCVLLQHCRDLLLIFYLMWLILCVYTNG